MLLMLTLITHMITELGYDKAQIKCVFKDLIDGGTTLEDQCDALDLNFNAVSTDYRESFYRSLPNWESAYHDVKLFLVVGQASYDIISCRKPTTRR